MVDECDFGRLRNICKGRPVPDHLRAEVWQVKWSFMDAFYSPNLKLCGALWFVSFNVTRLLLIIEIADCGLEANADIVE